MFDPESLGLDDPNVPDECKQRWIAYLSEGAAKRHLMRKRTHKAKFWAAVAVGIVLSWWLLS